MTYLHALSLSGVAHVASVSYYQMNLTNRQSHAAPLVLADVVSLSMAHRQSLAQYQLVSAAQ